MQIFVWFELSALGNELLNALKIGPIHRFKSI